MRHMTNLRFIDAVAREKSIRKAAEKMAITSTALNRRILGTHKNCLKHTKPASHEHDKETRHQEQNRIHNIDAMFRKFLSKRHSRQSNSCDSGNSYA